MKAANLKSYKQQIIIGIILLIIFLVQATANSQTHDHDTNNYLNKYPPTITEKITRPGNS